MPTRRPHPFAQLAAIAVAGAISQLAHAHSSGHGPAISGLGKHGGKLAAIISAGESELGAKAKAVGVAEWVQEKGKLTVYLWSEKRDRAIKIPEAAELKWIVVGGSLSKPEVVKTVLKSATERPSHAFEPKLLEQAEGVEVILPGLGERTGKHVFFVKLK